MIDNLSKIFGDKGDGSIGFKVFYPFKLALGGFSGFCFYLYGKIATIRVWQDTGDIGMAAHGVFFKLSAMADASKRYPPMQDFISLEIVQDFALNIYFSQKIAIFLNRG